MSAKIKHRDDASTKDAPSNLGSSRKGDGNNQLSSQHNKQSSLKKKSTNKKNTQTKTPIDSAPLRIIPLGGLDAIGKNMTVFEYKNNMIVDDAGLMFPDDDHPGIDLILPDYTYILENAYKLKGIFITHGHEDHTGCLPYLLKDLDVQIPIYATKLTLGLIEGKLEEHKIKNAKLVEVKPGDCITLGCFTVHFFAVNHSIPGAVGVFIESPAGNVLHTGDFKLDQTPIDGVTTDFGALSRFGKMGVDLMMSDSTNATVNTFTPSEAEVGKVLQTIMANAKGRVIIASFASHIHRLQQICDAAIACNRKVVVTGRSMVQNTEIARRLGYLHVGDEYLVDAYDLKSMPKEQTVVMCTGSQGEPLSALTRIANGEHRTIPIEQGDTVIISATPVPGNEKAVTRVINSLAKIGADVYDKSRAMVHVSGHAAAEELKLVLSIVSPRAFMPVHGESMHLLAHANLAKDVGVNPNNIFICDNGEVLELNRGKISLGKPVQSGVVLVDGLSVGDTSQIVLDERNKLGSQGVAILSAAIDRRARKVKGEIAISMRGITGGDDIYLQSELQKCIYNALSRALFKNADLKAMNKIGKDALLSLLWERTKQRPMVIVNLIEV